MALLSSSTNGYESSSSVVGRHLMASRAAGDTVFSGIEVSLVVHPSLHLLAFVCDYLHTGGFERGRLVLSRTQCLLNVIVHSPDVLCYGGCLYILAELCPILVRTSPRGLLNLATGSSG